MRSRGFGPNKGALQMKYYKITLTDLDGFDHTEIIEANTLERAINKAYVDGGRYVQEWDCTSGQLLTEEEAGAYIAEQEAIRIQYWSEREFV